MQDNIIVGRAKGPGDASNEFKIITPDNKRMKIGEFVYYLQGRENKEKVLCRIVSRKAVRLYPDEFMSDPTISPSLITSMMGVESEHLYEVSATILGRYDDNFGFLNPRIPPDPGTEIYLAENEYLEHVISRKKRNDIGSAYVGSLLNRDEGEVKIFLDVAEIASKHLAVLAATGSGKSYTVGVILEEIMGKNNRGSVLVIDPHGEYGTIDEMRNNKEYEKELCEVKDGYKPEVKVITPNDIHIRVSDLEWGDWRSILKDASDKMLNILRNVLYPLRKKNKNFTVDDLLEEIRSRLGERGEYDESSIRGLEWRIDEYIGKRKIFCENGRMTEKTTSLRDLFAPGQITVLQMTEHEEDDQQLIVSVLLNRLLRARIRTEKKMDVDEDMKIDFPVFVVLEEAHRFAPHFGEARSKYVLKTILSEGRKFGIGVCLVSQRPGKLDGDALSQCLTQIIMKIINPTDQENIKQSVESITADLMKELPALTKGQAVVVGEAINTPVLMRVRKRYTKHGGASQNAPEQWVKKCSKEEKERRERDKAPLKKETCPIFRF